MKDETTRATAQNEDLQTAQVQPANLIPYHKPTLQHYGGLAELVQRNPGRGTDGGALDCTHS